MEEIANFLNCKVGSTPFKYLGVSVGANARKVETWMPLIDHLKRKLNKWEHRCLSFGGRLTLINAVLANIPVYTMSVYKAPKRVVKMVEKIQRDFLWGAKEGERKIMWVAWKNICQEKEIGGLGVKNMRWMNLALLGKWRWRLLNEEGELWHQVLVAKYKSNGQGEWRRDNRLSSQWWKEIWGLQNQGGEGVRWLDDCFKRVVGNGAKTKFWNDVWIGDQALKQRFGRLFSISEQKENTIAALVTGTQEEGWRWGWSWRRELRGREEEIVEEMESYLPNPSFLQVFEDSWAWSGNVNGVYTVNKAYKLLNAIQGIQKEQLMEAIWCSPMPKKVKIFLWRAARNRLPSKTNLHRRGALNSEDQVICSMCGEQREDLNHILLNCKHSNAIWASCLKWWNLSCPLPNSLVSWLKEGVEFISQPRLNVYWFCVMGATLWVIWNTRNKRIFEGERVQEMDILSKVQWFSWEWLVNRGKARALRFSNWKENPTMDWSITTTP